MQIQSSQAIVLRHADYGEADRVMTLFTLEQGLMKGFARGARNSRKRFGAALELFSEIRLFWKAGRGGGLPTLQEAELENLRGGLRRDLELLTLAGYGCELVEALFGEGQPHPEVYGLLQGFLNHLDQSGAGDECRFLLELRALSLAGYIPHFLHCAECFGALEEQLIFSAERGGSLCLACSGGHGGVAVQLLTIGSMARSLLTPTGLFAGFRFSRTTLDEGFRVLNAALGQHLPRPLRSRAFLERFKSAASP
jgi:DNA repair protein RecO (recombination protein O)